MLLFAGCVHRPVIRNSSDNCIGIFSQELNVANEEIAEERLLDIAIAVFESDPELDDNTPNNQKLSEIINDAEGSFIAQHLKKTLDRSRHWGTIRIVPEPIGSSDLSIEAEIVRSDGSNMVIRIRARDSSGVVWFNQLYCQSVSGPDFTDLVKGERDVFQPFYDDVANRLADFWRDMPASDLIRIRDITTLRFAARISPDPFADFFSLDEYGAVILHRLPSRNAPELQRVLRIKQRDRMFSEVLNGHYNNFYDTIWPSYVSWRREITVERDAKYLARLEGRKKKRLGAMLIGAAAVLGVSGIDSAGGAAAIMAGVGVAQVVTGLAKGKQIKLHGTAIRELTESFATESKPIVIEFEGKQIELVGTAKEQFAKWQTILRQLYQEEAGFNTTDSQADSQLINSEQQYQ